MSKRIVIPLDGSVYSKNALEIAKRRAKNFHSKLIGMAVVDLPGIDKMFQDAPFKGSKFTKGMEQGKVDEALGKAKSFLDEFEKMCEDESIEYEIITHTGPPSEEIIEEGRTADLIILGLRTYFQYRPSEKHQSTLVRLLSHPVCPVLSIPEKFELPERTIIAYDGSVNSSKAMRAFAHLNQDFEPVSEVILLHVTDNMEASKKILGKSLLDKAESFLADYGMKVSKVFEKGKPHEVIKKLAKDKKPAQVVLAPYGRSGASDYFFGSTAKELVEDGTIPLFLYL